MKIIPMSTGLGAEIFDADIKDPDNFAQIKEAFAEYSVITLRRQSISPDDHLAFASRFGAINVNRFFKTVDGYPNIAMVFKDKTHKEAVGESWHTDHSYDDQPAMGSILHAIEVPPVGGDTVFASTALAFDGLSDKMKTFVLGLRAWHSSRHAFGAQIADTEGAQTGRYQNSDAAVQDVLHPVVIRHPLSGKPCLYVNPGFTTRIEGLADDESDAILNMLYTHCQKPMFQCRVRWQAGDVTMWDNRSTWHIAVNDYHGHRRLMHRVTVDGCSLNAA